MSSVLLPLNMPPRMRCSSPLKLKGGVSSFSTCDAQSPVLAVIGVTDASIVDAEAKCY